MSAREEPLRIWWNKNLHGKITPMKLAAHAAHAALAAYGVQYTHPIVVLAAGKAKIEAMPINIHDAGYTELEPGTLTTGVEKDWTPAISDAQVQRLREAIAAQTGVYPSVESAETILRATLAADRSESDLAALRREAEDLVRGEDARRAARRRAVDRSE